MNIRNTKTAAKISSLALVTSCILSVISKLSDIFTFEDGIIERKTSFLDMLVKFLVFLGNHWKWILLVTIILLVIFLFFKLLEIKKMRKRLVQDFSWFAPEQRNTNFSGGAEYLYRLKFFFRQKNVDFSWWAVTGVAGMGKTRLVIEALRDNDFADADIKWIKELDEYREDNLKKRVDAILESRRFRNFIIAEDAQIYMDNIGVLINYIAGKSNAEIGDHKIRLLLLIRMGEDEDLTDRYKQLESKFHQSKIPNTRFKEFGDELTIGKYTEADIDEVVKSYAINTKKSLSERKLTEEQIADLQAKTKRTLKSEIMDSNHLRPLFAMFITDALLSGKEPMSWNREKVLEYAVVEREDKFMSYEATDLQLRENRLVFDKVRGIICLSIIRNGLDISELVGIREELEEELKHSRITLNDFLREMQLLSHNGIIRTHMPDILSEYYVLRNLILNPDKAVKPWILGRLCISLEGAKECRKKIRQDYKYLYGGISSELRIFYHDFFKKCDGDLAFDILKGIVSAGDLENSSFIIFQESIKNQIRNNNNIVEVAEMLYDAFNYLYEINQNRECLAELEHLSGKYAENTEIAVWYSKGLFHLLNIEPEIKEKRSRLAVLGRLARERAENADIVLAYCYGLFNLVIEEPGIEEKQHHLSVLKYLAGENTENDDVVFAYSQSLFNILCCESEIMEKRGHLAELERLSLEKSKSTRIVYNYSKGLYNILSDEVDAAEKHRHLLELKRLARENAENTDIALAYCYGLFYMLNDEPSIIEKLKHLSELKRLSKKYTNNYEFSLMYCNGLHNMRCYDKECDEKYTLELRRLLSDKNLVQYVVEQKSDIITYSRYRLIGSVYILS